MTPDANGWRSDMENAPRDGIDVLLYAASGCFNGVRIGFWNDALSCWQVAVDDDCFESDEEFDDERPSHWQPLPAPPVSEGRG